MQLTIDVEKDLIKVLTLDGFTEAHAQYVVWAASEDDNGKVSQEWALRAVENAIVRVCSKPTDSVAI